MNRLIRPVVLAGALIFGAGAAVAQNIPIAVVGPLTGSNAAIGEQMKRGAEMAVADINAKGGVLGKKLQVMIADDACDPKQAVAAARQRVGPEPARRHHRAADQRRNQRGDHPVVDEKRLPVHRLNPCRNRSRDWRVGLDRKRSDQ